MYGEQYCTPRQTERYIYIRMNIRARDRHTLHTHTCKTHTVIHIYAYISINPPVCQYIYKWNAVECKREHLNKIMFRISVVEPCNGYLCLSAKTHGSPFSIDYYDSYTSEQTDNPFTGEKILQTSTRILLWMLLIEVCEALNSPGAGLCRQHRGVHNTFSKKQSLVPLALFLYL